MSEKVHDRLDSWKAIAEYLDRDPTTVMRWAKERGLPVYVVPGEAHRHRAVYAYKGEIDAWLRRLADHGAAALQNERHNRVAHPEEAHAEEVSERAAPQAAGVSIGIGETPGSRLADEGAAPQAAGVPVVAPTALPSSPSPHPGTRRTLWAVFLGAAIVIAVAAAAWLRVRPSEPKVLRFEQLTNDGFQKRPTLVTDGARVYFTENSRDGWVVAEIPTSGGNPVAIARANRDSAIQDISPDRSALLLIQEGGLRPGSVWILPLLAGSSRRVGSIQAFSAAWSPDGAALAYTTDDGLYLCDANGSNSRRVVAMSGRLDNVRWSPHGQQLCMTRFSSNETRLWEVDRDGKGLRRLFPNWDIPHGEGSGFWTPDGKYLVFQAFHAGHEEPWALRLSAGLLKRNEQATCLSLAGVDLDCATMSPDSSRLYGVGRTRTRYQIERYDTPSKQFLPCLPDITASALDFTKDGQWVAYVDDHSWLCKSRNDGGEKVQLTLPPLEVELPRWSPDGKWIAFMGQDPGQPWKVRLVSAEGGPYGPVTSTDAAEGAPSWSPDGSRLAFGGLVNPGTRTPGPLLIHIFDLKERHLSVVAGSEGLWTARWSPDGRYIAALTEDSRSLMLFDFRARKWTKLLTVGQIWDLHWSRQGRSIYLTAAPPGGEPALFRVKIPGHQPERLTSLEGIHDARWLGLAPDDSPLVVRQVSGAEIYAFECQFP
jgi:Tol biopolymer transport system component